jgi:hypothetical protein
MFIDYYTNGGSNLKYHKQGDGGGGGGKVVPFFEFVLLLIGCTGDGVIGTADVGGLIVLPIV